MTQTKPKYRSVEDYLNEPPGEFDRAEYFEGELIKMPPESGKNVRIATAFQLHLIFKGFFPFTQVVTGACEIQVERFHQDDKETRMPDLTIIRSEHIALTDRRFTIRLSMPSPLLIAEIVSPYASQKERNYQEDYIRKPYQYAMRGIPEYWIIDPQSEMVTVQDGPQDGGYNLTQEYVGSDRVRSQLPELKELQLTAQQILNPEGGEG